MGKKRAKRSKSCWGSASALLVLLLILFLVALSAHRANAQAQAEDSAYGGKIDRNTYEISRSQVVRKIAEGEIFHDSFIITNKAQKEMRVTLAQSDALSEIIKLPIAGAVVPPLNSTEVDFEIIGKEQGTFSGEIVLSGDVNEKLFVNITITNQTLNPEFFVEIESIKNKFTFNDLLDFKVHVEKLLDIPIKNVSFKYYLSDKDGNFTKFLGEDRRDLDGSFELRKRFQFPDGMKEGFYVLSLETSYNEKLFVSKTEFSVVIPFWERKLFGVIPMWLLATILSLAVVGVVAFVIIRREIEKRKKYKMQLDTKTLPKKTDRTLWLGKVAETNITAYLDMDLLTTHAVVAGATGGGKSISAQVIIEEALMKGIAVLVFDPTAQWSGMLRKCT
ncbi:DUF853 family protein, partial [Candidatus Pacearchaeota archaeon]